MAICAILLVGVRGGVPRHPWTLRKSRTRYRYLRLQKQELKFRLVAIPGGSGNSQSSTQTYHTAPYTALFTYGSCEHIVAARDLSDMALQTNAEISTAEAN